MTGFVTSVLRDFKARDKCCVVIDQHLDLPHIRCSFLYKWKEGQGLKVLKYIVMRVSYLCVAVFVLLLLLLLLT